MKDLPFVMVAPNGARLTKADHPALPVTIDEIMTCTLACRVAGADGLHAHVRDAEQRHVLDAGLYAELLSELERLAPGFYVQITSEAAGSFTPAEQRRLVQDLRPDAVSVALREITAMQDEVVTRRFFALCDEAGIGVQHILYDGADVAQLTRLVAQGDVPRAGLKALIVLGRYTIGQTSAPEDVALLAEDLKSALPGVDWSACAFGPNETACLIETMRHGGKARIGFENNRLNADGRVAVDNAERVAELVTQAKLSGLGWQQDTRS
ncbi:MULTISPECIES: 3-keto-5-aminohexanoate cleavage protein [unclassified Sulfitobacter]|uniref:3-keto-5-aminohexanoate cleavage protein n=1 Tax=unclassified Sulfitobacter TaxID=196795 RepID=UPI0007C285FE|nr:MULTISPECIES: 3-keto-5-aminohexanoate cleavage protein [unclassified Sulfitobacter]KZX98881.1 class III aminotransferase [Sulfitobacter sp. HI0021]KZY01876.1 class III aminotransferase [Sulfitobacter sp. HI0027]KZZ03557.1 class III aminotransferase [Sulfitobacter sp. HI0076]